MEGKRISAFLPCEAAWDQGLMAENGRRKNRNEGQDDGHILVRMGAGLWLLLSPITTLV